MLTTAVERLLSALASLAALAALVLLAAGAATPLHAVVAEGPAGDAALSLALGTVALGIAVLAGAAGGAATAGRGAAAWVLPLASALHAVPGFVWGALLASALPPATAGGALIVVATALPQLGRFVRAGHDGFMRGGTAQGVVHAALLELAPAATGLFTSLVALEWVTGVPGAGRALLAAVFAGDAGAIAQWLAACGVVFIALRLVTETAADAMSPPRAAPAPRPRRAWPQRLQALGWSAPFRVGAVLLGVVVLANAAAPWVGVDGAGALSRAGWTSLVVMLASGALALVIATACGGLGGYAGGGLDRATSAIVRAVLALPAPFLLLPVVLLAGGDRLALVVGIGAVSWLPAAEGIRRRVVELREEAYMDAAVVAGRPPFAAMQRHLVPNVRGALAVAGAVALQEALAGESFVSFVGAGFQAGSWGALAGQAGFSALAALLLGALFAALRLAEVALRAAFGRPPL